MERLTVNDLNKVCYDPLELCGMDSYCKKSYHEEGGCAKGCHILKMYRKLAEYENLEEQHKLVKLPCNVGDTIYRILGTHKIRKSTVVEIRLGETCWVDTGTGDLIHFFEEFGKTIFLSPEVAQKALEKIHAGSSI